VILFVFLYLLSHDPKRKGRDQDPATGRGVTAEDAMKKNDASRTRRSSGIITAVMTAPSARPGFKDNSTGRQVFFINERGTGFLWAVRKELKSELCYPSSCILMLCA